MARKREPHVSVTLRVPRGLYDLLDAVASAEQIDRSAVILQMLSRHVAELRARARPTRELLRSVLLGEMDTASASAVLDLVSAIRSGAGDAEIAHVLTIYRALPSAPLTNDQLVREALTFSRAWRALEDIRDGQTKEASQG